MVGQRHLDGDSAGDPDLWWIELKAAPAEDHFVTNRGGDLNELLAEADRAATDGDVLGSEVRAKMPGQRGLELHAAVAGSRLTVSVARSMAARTLGSGPNTVSLRPA
ncbi:hypothetical protein J113_26325 [Mycobacterium tuberculosis CAS/NITR204]|uniref:Uncharacterized protein n=1 Tax=Mycobacterium tuberculosis CAS/NITR204 TaxID=1310114 RepID=R4ME79_MYCTX|nr:hypothetical protein J113_26325 [Mycobacterium tuberculosis CAS/NITR204]